MHSYLPRGLLIAAMALAACGPPPRAEPAPAPPARPLRQGALADFVQAAGLRWLAVGSPQALAHDTAIATELERLFPKQRLDAFERGSGVDLRRVPSALAAGFDYSTLYAAEIGSDGAAAQTAFTRRMVTEVKRRELHPDVTLITGMVGSTPQTMVHVRDRFVAVAVGDPSPARVLSLFVQGRLRRAVPAMRGAALSTLPVPELERGTLRFYAPGPFEDEWSRGARSLLGRSLACGASATVDGERVDVQLVIAGSFDPAADLPTAEAAWQDLAEHPLGHLLGLSTPAQAPRVEMTKYGIQLRVSLDIRPILLGLHSAVAADVWQMMDFAAPSPASGPISTPRTPAAGK